MKKIAIYGAGGVGVDTISLVENINHNDPVWEIIGIFDDFVSIGSTVLEYPVLGGLDVLNKWDQELALVIGISDPSTKKDLLERIANSNIYYPSLIHPNVVNAHASTTVLGEGIVVFAGVVIMPRVTIGIHTLIYLNSTIGHDANIGSYCSIMPGVNISGKVDIAEEVFVGTGAKIIQDITIGPKTTIGAGAVVINNIAPFQTVIGVPGKPVPQKDQPVDE